MTIKTWQVQRQEDGGPWRLPDECYMQAEIDELRARLDAWEQQEAVGYLAWYQGQPAWDEDCVCKDAVYPVDEFDSRTSEPLYTKPKEPT